MVAACRPVAQQEPVTAFVNVNLVPMTHDTVIPKQTVLVKGERITAVGPSKEIKIPRKAIIIDGAGSFLMPGLADMHMHTGYDWFGPAWPVFPLKLYLANGVTTIRCLGPLGRTPDLFLNWRKEARESGLPGPNIYTSGPVIYGPVPNPLSVVSGQKASGFDLIKIYSFVTRQEFQELMSAAKGLDIYTVGHIPFSVGLDGVISRRMDEIAHIEELDFEFIDFEPDMKLNVLELFRNILEQTAGQYGDSLELDIKTLEERSRKEISEVVGKLKRSDIPICTTLVVGEGIVNKLTDPQAFTARRENVYLPKAYLETFRLGKEKHQVIFRGYEALAPFKYNMEKILAKELKRAGVTLLLGTDSGTGGMGIVPGFSIHDELRILTEAGLTPYEAIRTGTVNAAKVVGKMTGNGDFGTIEVGKRADLVLVKGDPLKDVVSIREPLGVMAAGQWYPEDDLKEMIAIE